MTFRSCKRETTLSIEVPNSHHCFKIFHLTFAVSYFLKTTMKASYDSSPICVLRQLSYHLPVGASSTSLGDGDGMVLQWDEVSAHVRLHTCSHSCSLSLILKQSSSCTLVDATRNLSEVWPINEINLSYTIKLSGGCFLFILEKSIGNNRSWSAS